MSYDYSFEKISSNPPRYKVSYNFEKDELASPNDVIVGKARIYNKPDIRPFEFDGELPWAFYGQLYLGPTRLCRYNYNPFKEEIFVETLATRYRMGFISREEAEAELVQLVLCWTNGMLPSYDPGISPLTFDITIQAGEIPRTNIHEPQLFNEILKRMKEFSTLHWWDLMGALDGAVEALLKYANATLLPNLIHVAFCVDKIIVPHLEVAMASILKNTEDPVMFHIFYLKGTPVDLPRWMPRVHLVEINPKDLRYFKLDRLTDDMDYITLTTYARFLIPRLLPEVKRVIYLDVDVLVERSLTPLWNFNLLGAGLAMAANHDPIYFEKSFHSNTYQAGVILMDLDWLRREDFEKRIRKLAKEELEKEGRIEAQDQGLLNRLYGKQIMRLPIFYNFCVMQFHYGHHAPIGDNYSALWLVVGEKFCKKITIFHYAGREKAWDNPDEHSRYKYYKKYAKTGKMPL